MCTGLELFMGASTALSVGGSILQGQEQQQQAQAQAAQTLKEAAYNMEAAKQTATNIRRAGRETVGAAKTSYAASGVKLGSGTSDLVQKTITQRSEQDALTAILNGQRGITAAKEQAGVLQQAGNNAVTGSYINAGSTLLAAGADYARGNWKETAKGK